MRKFLKELITTNIENVSSKVVIGSLTYFLITIVLLIISFINPEFPGLGDLITVLIITSASLLGLTTVENIKINPFGKKSKKNENEIQN